LSFSGIEISKLSNKEPRVFYCDSLAFYTEELSPLDLQPQPKRNLEPYRGQIAGVNVGPGRLPFPTREETILPANREKDYRLSVNEIETGRFELRYEGRDARVLYEYRPRTGNLGELTVSVNGGDRFHPLDGGGVRFWDTPAGSVPTGHLVEGKLAGNVVQARFFYGGRSVDYQLRLWQKSLVLDVWCDGGDATELSFGRVTGVSLPKTITVPFITYSGGAPRDVSDAPGFTAPEPTTPRRLALLYQVDWGLADPLVLMSGASDAPVFTSIWFDWYRSSASTPYFRPSKASAGVEINGGMRYLPKTDGLRNNLYERIFVTNSPVYEEVLPTIPNPPSLRQQESKQVIWTIARPASFQDDHDRCRQIRSYGLDKIMQHSHETTWRDEGDSFTLRLRAAPQKGGDSMLQWYIKAQHSLGWLQGVYTNYTDFTPTNTNWSPAHVSRTQDGEWAVNVIWPRVYNLKPSKAVEFDQYYAGRIKEKFGTSMAYTDVHTSVGPWRYVDFDTRVPGAGTFAATYYAYGQILRNDQQVYGPDLSEGTQQWLYAGLSAGNWGRMYGSVNLLTHPLDVSFKLMKIQPLECDYGMGFLDNYLGRIDKNWYDSPKRSAYVDLYMATAIGYGNMGWLVHEVEHPTPFGGTYAVTRVEDSPWGIDLLTRSYYMMQQLQQQYAFTPPMVIEYAGRDRKWYTPSQAHATGVIADSRLHVIYENRTEVYVNRASEGSWTVSDHRGQRVELPVSGWLAFNPSNQFYEISGYQGGRRIDYVQGAEYEFLDGRGQWTERGTLGCSGSVARRPRPGGGLELIDIYGNRRIAFRTAESGTLTAYDPDRKSLKSVKLTAPRPGWFEFQTLAGARSYVFHPREP
jgi:hypothetical protein